MSSADHLCLALHACLVLSYSWVKNLMRSPRPTRLAPLRPCREGFVGLSVADTLRQCYKLGLAEQAARISKDFKARPAHVVLLCACYACCAALCAVPCPAVLFVA